LQHYQGPGAYPLSSQPVLDASAPDVSFCDTGTAMVDEPLTPWQPMSSDAAAQYRLYYKVGHELRRRALPLFLSITTCHFCHHQH